jgi:hypothetical protein
MGKAGGRESHGRIDAGRPSPATHAREVPMTRSWRTLRVLILVMAAVLALGACGGGSTPAASSGSGGSAATAAPAATDAPAATTGSAESAAPGASGGIDLGGAAASLDNLDNYSFKIGMTSTGASEGMMGLVKPGGGITMEGTVVLKPAEAADVVMTLSDGTTDSRIGYRIIGDTAYTSFGDTWMSTPASDAENAIDAFKPEKMLSGYSNMPGLGKVGDEDKNGIPSTHYASTAEPGSGASDVFGLPGASWQTDIWVARDGGFIVSAVMVATGKTSAGEEGSFTVSVDVTAVNTPNVTIEKPKDVMEIPS